MYRPGLALITLGAVSLIAYNKPHHHSTARRGLLCPQCSLTGALFAQTSVDSAVAISDLSVVVDLLNIVNQKA